MTDEIYLPNKISVNPLKLHKELQAVGLPVSGVRSDGFICFTADLTEEQFNQAVALLDQHDPTPSIEDQRLERYLQEGLTDHELIVALWEHVIENRPESAAILQAVRLRVKTDLPVPAI
jgi:hypothetical protein